MANNVFQLKRSSVSGKEPNTSVLSIGELAINITDRKLFSSNGSSIFEVGSNLSSLSVTSTASFGNSSANVVSNSSGLYTTGVVNAATLQVGSSVTANSTKLVIGTGVGLQANGGIGTAGQVLASNGTTVYWTTASGTGTVTSVATGNGLTGGPITTTGTVSVLANNGITANSTGLFVTQGTGAVVNATGVHVNAAYINTISSNSAIFLAGNTVTTNSTVLSVGSLGVNTLGIAANTFQIGTAAYVVSNGNVGINASSPASRLVVSENSTVPTPINNTLLNVVGADSAAARITLESFAGAPNFSFRRSAGTAASPSAIQSGQSICSITSFGYGATGYSSNQRAAIQSFAAENWTDSAQGTYWIFSTTATSNTTVTERMRIAANGNVGIGTTAPAATLDITGTYSVAAANALSQTLTYGANTTWNTASGQIATVTLTGNTNFDNPTNLKIGTYVLNILQDGTGSRTATWSSSFKWPAGTAPVLTTTGSRRDIVFFYSDGTNLYGSFLPDVR